mmetsp:Transcript_25446/g.19193  ORF Transcript_25446/g.19193 Transcript_25446/m.19193 type:complete len:199 (-) Transcript_25446:283-879(-)
MYEVFKDKKYMYIVTELVKGGELYDELLNNGRLVEKNAAVLMRELLMAVSYMHKRGVVHRDLKPENILLEENKDFGQIKVIDFGTAAILKEGQKLEDRIGTPYYIAPEVLDNQYDEKCDLWSCGVIAFQLLTGVKPFNATNDKDVLKQIIAGKIDFGEILWGGVAEEAKDFVQKLLQYDPNARMTALEALEHPFIKKY